MYAEPSGPLKRTFRYRLASETSQDATRNPKAPRNTPPAHPKWAKAMQGGHSSEHFATASKNVGHNCTPLEEYANSTGRCFKFEAQWACWEPKDPQISKI